jgi:hypothetical protein
MARERGITTGILVFMYADYRNTRIRTSALAVALDKVEEVASIDGIGENDLAVMAAIHEMVESRWGLLKLARPTSHSVGLPASIPALTLSRFLSRLG